MPTPLKNFFQRNNEADLEPRVLLAASIESDSANAENSEGTLERDRENRVRTRSRRIRNERVTSRGLASPAVANNRPATNIPSAATNAPIEPAVESRSSDRTPASAAARVTSQSTASQIKARIADIFDRDTQVQTAFADSGYSRDESLAALFAVASRESAGSSQRGDGEVNFRPNLETGSGASHAFGVGQAAETSFQGGRFQPLNVSGNADIPNISQFNNPDAATRAFVSRISEGLSLSLSENPNFTRQQHLLASLAHHNTGHPSDAADPSWRRAYGDEVLRLQQGYLQGDNLTNDRVFYTGENF